MVLFTEPPEDLQKTLAVTKKYDETKEIYVSNGNKF